MSNGQRKLLGRYLVADPEICHGKPTFLGTRILVADVLELVAAQMEWGKIIRECHDRITAEAIADAVRLAGRSFLDHAEDYAEEPIPS